MDLINIFSRVVIFFLAGGAAAAAVPTTSSMRTECVGRMQLALPGDADFSAMQPSDFKNEFKGSAVQPAYQFPDGQSAAFVKIQYGGNLFVTHPLGESEQTKFRSIARDWMNDLSRTIKKGHGKGASGKPLQFENLASQNTMIAWRVNRDYIVYKEVGKNSILWKAEGEVEDVPTLSRDSLALVTGALPRGIFSLPEGAGVCLPYAFIRDDGQAYRSISVAYRLKAYPDITVWLEDETAEEHTDPVREENAQPDRRIADFWSQYKLIDEQISMLWRFPSLHSVKMDNRSGLSSFVKIRRKDKSEDYGFFAVVRGQPNAKGDRPDLRLYVIRDSTQAGHKPVSALDEKSFLAMAENIAASVRARSVR